MLLALALAACDEEMLPLPADVDAVFADRCRRCHSDPPANFAPMPLVTWNDLHATAPSGGKRVYVRVGERIHNVDFPMPPLRSDELTAFTDGERALLDAWIAAGAPPAEESDGGAQ